MDAIFYYLSKAKSFVCRVWQSITSRRPHYSGQRGWRLLRRQQSPGDVSSMSQPEVSDNGQTTSWTTTHTERSTTIIYYGDRG